ncbi:MAG: hypothetical protein HY282_16825 [Nitrospirae bacterium]|nr:hypothetical protein [Candidatus Manganitrophaceae bacterium]
MKRNVLFLILGTLLFLAVASPAGAVKPRPPLGLFLQQGEASEGGIPIALVATANVDVGRVELSIELPPGLSLTTEAPTWEGPLKKGETHRIEFVLQNPGGNTPRKVTGKAIVHLDPSGTFVERSTLILNGAQGQTPSPPPSVKRKQGKESILEYKGE